MRALFSRSRLAVFVLVTLTAVLTGLLLTQPLTASPAEQESLGGVGNGSLRLPPGPQRMAGLPPAPAVLRLAPGSTTGSQVVQSTSQEEADLSSCSPGDQIGRASCRE